MPPNFRLGTLAPHAHNRDSAGHRLVAGRVCSDGVQYEAEPELELELEPKLEPLIPGQWCPLWEPGIGAPGWALEWVLVELVAGAPELVDVVLDEVAAFAIAAPPPTSAPVTASVVRMDLILWLILVHLLWMA
jgi:hypothetical protein